MKTYTPTLLVCSFAILIAATSFAAPESGCKATVPAHATVLTNVGTSAASDGAIVACDMSITLMGTDNVVFFVDSAGTVTGTDNTLYVDADSTLTVTGTDNVVYVDSDAVVTSLDSSNRIIHCDALELDDRHVRLDTCESNAVSSTYDEDSDAAAEELDAAAEELDAAAEELAVAAQILGALEGSGPVANDDLPEASAHPSNVLIGTWIVTRGELNGEPVTTDGKVIFYSNGTGFSSYSAHMGSLSLPQIGAFRWTNDRSNVYVETDYETQTWNRLRSEPNRQKVALQLEDGMEAVLVLERK